MNANDIIEKCQPPLTYERLRELLEYDRETGIFTWRTRTRGKKPQSFNVKFAGRTAGNQDRRGYCQISIDQKRYWSHRLAWLYMTGEWPTEDVDHINLDRSDNRFCNLRVATRSQNIANTRKRSTNKSGFKGVFKMGPTEWHARITVNRTFHHLGIFQTGEAAHAAYEAASKRYFDQYGRAE